MRGIKEKKLKFLKKINSQKMLIFIMLNIIALNFILSTDDYIFANLNFYNMWEFIFNNKGTNTWDIKNGRYIGNTIGVLLSMTYKFEYLKYIRGIFMGSGIFILILLCSELSNLDKNIKFIITTALILLAPVEIYAQVYSWTAAYVNYLIPTIIFLIILLILRKYINENYKNQNKEIFLIFILGLSCQLFIENVTIYLVIFSFSLCVFSYYKYKDLLNISIPLFISNLIGMGIMFSCKGYRQINSDGYRSININHSSEIMNTIVDKGLTMIDFIIFDNCFLISILLILCFLIRKHSINNNKKNSYIILLIIPCLIFIRYMFRIKGVDLYDFPKGIRITKYLSDCIVTFGIMWILTSTIWKFIEYENLRRELLFYYISIVGVVAPLIIVNPISTRCFFMCYIFLVLMCINLIAYVIKQNIIQFEKLNIIVNILVILILINKLYIFNNIHNQFEEIISYTNEEMLNKNMDTILIPKFKYQKYVYSDTSDFIGFLYYHNTPNDIKFKTIDRDKWEEIANNK